ncbi:hypothetical protein E2C01_018982 [Portunus trituberculatus]|uniref:Uncharacterized protein n=1 Tax=Portunus trituberculatus TaxID=210409 RepID=A0A5B7DXN2_PORTR|nr:hypothetical protein [Portunus trituberculatus]
MVGDKCVSFRATVRDGFVKLPGIFLSWVFRWGVRMWWAGAGLARHCALLRSVHMLASRTFTPAHTRRWSESLSVFREGGGGRSIEVRGYVGGVFGPPPPPFLLSSSPPLLLSSASCLPPPPLGHWQASADLDGVRLVIHATKSEMQRFSHHCAGVRRAVCHVMNVWARVCCFHLPVVAEEFRKVDRKCKQGGDRGPGRLNPLFPCPEVR